MAGKERNGNGVALKLVLWLLAVALAAGGVLATVKMSAGTLVNHDQRIQENTTTISQIQKQHAEEMGEVKADIGRVSIKQEMMHDDIKYIKEKLK